MLWKQREQFNLSAVGREGPGKKIKKRKKTLQKALTSELGLQDDEKFPKWTRGSKGQIF